MRRMFRPALAWLCLCALALCAQAASDPVDVGRPAVRGFTDKDGLPQNSVMAMAYDARGYLWVGTQDGLATYNGREWSVTNLPNRTRSNFLRSMTISSDGAIWAGRENGGIARLLAGEWTTWDTSAGLPDGRVSCLLETRSVGGASAVWAGFGGGLARFSNGAWTVFTAESGMPSSSVLSLGEHDGALWVGTADGLARFDGERWATVELPITGPGSAVRALYESVSPDGARALWAGTVSGRIATLENGVWRALDVETGNSITCMRETRRPDGSKTMWVGTDGSGLWRYEGGSWRVFDTKSGMPNNSFWSLLAADAPTGTTTLWLGTDGGVGRMQLGRWTSFDTATGLPTDSVYGIGETVEPDGTRAMWIGTRGGGLSRLRNGEWAVFTTESGLPNNTVFSVFETSEADGGKTLWAGTQAGLARFDGGRWRAVEISGARTGSVRMARPGEGGVTWAASGGAGLLRYENGVWTSLGTESGLPTNNIFAAVETPAPGGKRAVWVGTEGNGVARWLDGAWTVWRAESSALPTNSVLSLHAWTAPDGRKWLWAGTEGGGAARLDLDAPEAGWTVISDATRPALPNNTVYQIREDAWGRLYMMTNKGVARLTPRQPTPDDAADFSVYTFTTDDGLPSNEFNGGASFVDSLGRIWGGTPAGAAVFDPAGEVADAAYRPLYVERSALAESGQHVAAGSSLAYNQNNLAFEYSLLSYFRERDTRYRTQLVGLDDHPGPWLPDFKKDYTTLPPGDYVFRVWARDYAGNVTGPVEIPFEVREAPWRTWWAYLIYLLLLGGAAYALVRYRLEALRRRNVELESAIAERTAQLAEKVEELEVSERTALEANRAKSIFLSNMSHELRTPLNAVLGFSQLMERDRSISGESRENLGIVQRSGEHLLGLINDVLSISKIEAGKLTLNEETFHLTNLLQGLEEMIRARAQAKGLRLVVDLAPEIPEHVRGDEGKLRQVLVNLLGNAVKFTDSGGIALRVRWADGRAFFEVEDTGVGIAPSEIETVFEAFVQSESGRRSKEGTGLGLAISRNFVELMGGQMSVRSEVGRGTVFSFNVALPAVEARDLPRGPRRVVGLEAGQPSYRVLVADDRWENRTLLVKLLEAVGFDVREAADGREAVAVWEEWRPDFIWMDMRMPVMDGAAATREIRSRETSDVRRQTSEGVNRQTKIVALTASAFEHERGAVLEAGCDDFVTKPYRESTIFEKLAEHLGARFVYSTEDGEEDAAREEGGGGALEPGRFAALPPQLVAELHEALTLGNVREAQFAVDNVALHDAPLAEELRRLVRGYQFDEILDTIEAAGLVH